MVPKKQSTFTVVLAPDSFKESMTAKEVCESMEKGIKEVDSSITCIQVPMADGGEGTMQSLIDCSGGRVYSLRVTGPLGETVTAEYGITGDGQTGVVELSSASGLHLVDVGSRNPLLTTTYGTGELIRACLTQHKVTTLIVGLGGSSTNDCGAGMLQALGAQLLDKDGASVPYGGQYLHLVTSLNLNTLDPLLRKVDIVVACDVDNPLCGPRGASVVYGPQKGATNQMVQTLDANQLHFGKLLEKKCKKDIIEVPGSGAAGGTGAALLALPNTTLQKGIDIVIRETRLEQHIQQCDLVLTGEGRMDEQTQRGKTPYGVALLAQKYNKPVLAFAGSIYIDAYKTLYQYFTSVQSIMTHPCTLQEAFQQAKQNLQSTVANAFRIMQIKHTE